MRTPVIALLTVLAAASQAGTILGIDNSGIYKIDVANGAATLAVSVAGRGTGDTNGLAYNPATDTAYFQRNGNLWSVNLGTGTFTNTMINVGSNAAATYHNGAYYYCTGAAIKKVDLSTNANTTVATYNKGWGFGDIATDKNGKLFGSSGGSMFNVNLANNAYSALTTTGSKNLQLAFVGSLLYGVGNGNSGTATGALFSINTATGQQSSLNLIAKYNGNALAIRDAATYQAVPEPASMVALAAGAFGILRRRRAKKA